MKNNEQWKEELKTRFFYKEKDNGYFMPISSPDLIGFLKTFIENLLTKRENEIVNILGKIKGKLYPENTLIFNMYGAKGLADSECVFAPSKKSEKYVVIGHNAATKAMNLRIDEVIKPLKEKLKQTLHDENK